MPHVNHMFLRRRRIVRRNFRRGIFWGRFVFGAFTILTLGGIIFKIHNNDVMRLEGHYGKKIENISEAELVQSMKKLGIKKLEVTEEEKIEVKES